MASKVLLVVLALAARISAGGDLIKLEEANFDSTVTDGFWMVEFYAPWCGHCKALDPILKEAATELKDKIRIGQVDATANKDLASKFQIQGYPTLKFRRDANSNFKKYKGSRTLEGFRTFVERMTGPSVTTITDSDTSAKYTKENPVWFLLGRPAEDEELAAAFSKIAYDLQDSLVFGQSSSDAVLASFSGDAEGMKSGGAFVVQVDGTERTYFKWDKNDKNNALETQLSQWVKKSKYPALSSLSSHNFHELGHETGRLMAIGVVSDDTNSAATVEFIKMMKKIAVPRLSPLSQDVRERFVFGHLDGMKWAKFLEQFNVVTADIPRLFVLDAVKSEFYEDKDVKTEDEIVQFLRDIASGKIIPQKEGLMGFPTRAWNMLRKWFPYSLLFAIPPILLIFAFCTMCQSDDDDDDEEEEEEEEEEDDGSTDKEPKKEK